MTITFPLPVELQGVGRVVGRFIVVTPDTVNDVDVYPEARGAPGSVTFTPATKLSKTADYAAFVGHPAKTFPVDEYGVMQDEQLSGGVWLREDVYTVSYNLSGLNIASHNIEVTSYHTEEVPLVLSVVGPAEPPTGSTLVVLQVPAGAVDGQLLSWSGTTGLVWMTGRTGDIVPDASTILKGIVELATNQEAIDGTDMTRAVTPAGVAAVVAAVAAAIPNWTTLVGKPAVVAAGDTQAAARTSIGAGTSSFSGAYADLTGKPAFAPVSGQFAVNTVAASGATETLPATHAAHKVTMDANCAFAFSAPTEGHAFVLHLSGAYTPTWPASVDWANGEEPEYDSAGTLYHFVTVDAGATWLGSGQAYS